MKFSQAEVTIACVDAGMIKPMKLDQIKAFDRALAQPNCAGYRRQGNRFYLLDYNRPTKFGLAPMGNVPDLWHPCEQFLQNQHLFIPAA